MKGKVVVFVLLVATTVFSRTGCAQSTLNFPKLFTPAELASSGFTIVNPSSTRATVTFTLYDSDGQIVRSIPRTFDPGTQDARLGAGANQIFGTASLGNGGWVQATSPVSGLTGFWLTFD